MNDHTNKPQWEGFAEAAEREVADYRALSGLAVVGFLLSLLSALSLVSVALSFIAAAAALCCIVALVRISAAPSNYSGRWLALTGLAIALFWAASGLARELTTERLLDIDSRDFALHWFEYLKNHEPEKALEMKSGALARRPLNEKLMDRILSSSLEYEGLQGFVQQPEVRAVLALGDRAEVRHYLCDGSGGDTVNQVYAVTYDDHGAKKSLLVEITLVRDEIVSRGINAWHVASTHAPWTPGNPS